MNVEVVPAALADAMVIDNLMQLYLHEFSAVDGRHVEEDGRFSYQHFDRYWSETGRYPFLICVDGGLAGFALVVASALIEPGSNGHSIAEFFVLRNHRRRRVGERAAVTLFDRFPGHWSVAEHAANEPAQAFWRAVIGRYTAGKYQEGAWRGDGEDAIVQTFDNSAVG